MGRSNIADYQITVMLQKKDTVTQYSIKQKPRGEQNDSEFYDGGEIDDEFEEDRKRASCGCFKNFKCRHLIYIN